MGRNQLDTTDLSVRHLAFLNTAIIDGSATHIFLPNSVARLMRKSGCFPWLHRTAPLKTGPLGVWYQNSNKVVYSHLHFSVYGKFQSQKVEEVTAIHNLLLSN